MKKYIFSIHYYDVSYIYYIEANNEIEALNKLKTYHENTVIFTNTEFTIGESGLSDWNINEITSDVEVIM